MFAWVGSVSESLNKKWGSGWGHVKAGLFGLSTAVATGITTLTAIFKTTNPASPAGMTVASSISVTSAVVDNLNTFFFQGQSIIASETETENKNLNSQKEASNKRNKACATFFSVGSQLGYLGFATSKVVFNRIFLIYAFSWLLDTPVTVEATLLITLFDALIKMSFGVTNESYESCQQIAKEFTGEKHPKPFYADLLRPLAESPKASKAFNIIGCLEHTLVDDIAPILTLIPKEVADYLLSDTDLLIVVGSLAGIIGLPLAILIFIQTCYFEGEHTKRHFHELLLASKNHCVMGVPHEKSPTFLDSTLAKTMNIMGPIHGVSAVVPLYVTLQQIIATTWIKWGIIIPISIFLFVCNAKGVHDSEVREAKELLTSGSSLAPVMRI